MTSVLSSHDDGGQRAVGDEVSLLLALLLLLDLVLLLLQVVLVPGQQQADVAGALGLAGLREEVPQLPG